MKKKDIKKKILSIMRNGVAFFGGSAVLILFLTLNSLRLHTLIDWTGILFACALGGGAGLFLRRLFINMRKVNLKLNRRESTYRELIENIDEIIFTLDSTGAIRFISTAITAYTGYSPEDLVGTSFKSYIYPDDLADLEDAFKMTLEGNIITREFRILTRSSEVVWMRSLGKTLPGKEINAGIEGLLYNISDRKNSEEALFRSEEHFRRMTENILDGLFIIENTTISYVNRRTCEILQSRSDMLIGRDISYVIESYISRENHVLADTIIEKLRKRRGSTGEMEFWITRKDNTRRYLHVRNSLTTDQYGLITRYAVVTDMTERHVAEEKLRETEEKFRIIFNNAGDAVIIHDANGTIYEVNNVAVARLGFPYDDLLRMNTREIVAPEARDRMPKTLDDYRKISLAFRETVHRARDGSLIPSEVNSRIIEYRGHSLILSIVRDVRERKRFENEIQRASKLESIGVLAGGIAHDFNNILMAIIGNISLAKLDSDKNSQVFNLLTDAENASWRARELTQQLLTFAKGGAPVKKTTSISDFVREVATFALRGTNIQSCFNFSDTLWSVDIDEGQMSQVLHNLIINANQAMPDGGEIRITCDNYTVNKGSSLPLPGGEFVRISVSDQGPGVPEDHLIKIFDPFFTTKEGGSGLGLTTSYSIIKKHGGYITAESPPKEGMTFHIFLPASRKKPRKKEQHNKLLHGRGEILLMDDDPMIRKVAGNMIEHLGYTVVFAKDGLEALQIYRDAVDAGHRFEAVVMDLTIPGGMGGKEAIKELLELDSTARVIVSSGYSNDQVMSDYRVYGFKGVVVKPYRIEELSMALKSVICEEKAETVT